ncbi:hypothetical protein [Adhaeribacter terreus]|uniref:Lipoprotein n=1 Tax=Adhaeribacter terreus TaxID=529703 RepID=A0ABW0EGQ6_9BACT
MRNLVLLSVVIIICSSCCESKSDTSIARISVAETISNLEYLTSTISRKVAKEGYKPFDKKILVSSEKLKGWRNNFLKSRSKTNLLAYSDSIYRYYFYHFNSEDSITIHLSKSKKFVTATSDTSAYLNLFFWTLKAEEAIQEVLVAKIGSTTNSWGFGGQLDVDLNAENLKVGDTLFATFRIPEVVLGEVKYYLDSIFVTELHSSKKIPRTIIQTGPIFIIQTIPKKLF